ncbi:MAG: hypothetical protein AAFX50_23365, partial [Acidobacteriota bacterium]
LVLPRGGRLSVDVRSLLDAGLEVNVQVLRPDGAGHRSIGGFDGAVRQSLLRSAGPTPLVAGRYEVVITADGREWRRPVTVTDGADIRVTAP